MCQMPLSSYGAPCGLSLKLRGNAGHGTSLGNDHNIPRYCSVLVDRLTVGRKQYPPPRFPSPCKTPRLAHGVDFADFRRMKIWVFRARLRDDSAKLKNTPSQVKLDGPDFNPVRTKRLIRPREFFSTRMDQNVSRMPKSRNGLRQEATASTERCIAVFSGTRQVWRTEVMEFGCDSALSSPSQKLGGTDDCAMQWFSKMSMRTCTVTRRTSAS